MTSTSCPPIFVIPRNDCAGTIRPLATAATHVPAAGDAVPTPAFGLMCADNILRGEQIPPALIGDRSSRAVLWSGTVCDDLFEADPRTWGPLGRKLFHSLCERVLAGAAAEPDRSPLPCFRPHARHVLCDVHSCQRFAIERASQRFELLFDPASMFTPSMLSHAPDHLERMFAVFAQIQCCAGVVLSNVVAADTGAAEEGWDIGPPMRRVGLTKGGVGHGQRAIPGDDGGRLAGGPQGVSQAGESTSSLVCELYARYFASRTNPPAIVLLDDDVEGQLAIVAHALNRVHTPRSSTVAISH